jgi:hypothetical protein
VNPDEDVRFVFHFRKQETSPRALLYDYPLREWTIAVRTSE